MRAEDLSDTESAPMAYYAQRYQHGADRWTGVSAMGPVAEGLFARVTSLAAAKPLLTVLDAGCGRLHVALALKKLVSNVDVVAIDFAYCAIVESEPDLPMRAMTSGIEFLNSSLFTFDPGRHFDVILDLGLLHHLVPSDWQRYSARIEKLLEPDGILLIRAFHPDDPNWGRGGTGGHVRNEYYCHYHTRESLGGALGGSLGAGELLAKETRPEHVECLYQFQKTTMLPLAVDGGGRQSI
jgi:SAM-dependent methyltransferase